MRDALDDYLRSCTDLSHATQRWYEQHLRIFHQWTVAEGLTLEDLRASHVTQFINHLRTTHAPRGGDRSDYTLRGYAQCIRTFLAWAAREDYCSERLAPKIRMPSVTEKVIEIFTPDHIAQLLDATNAALVPSLVARDKALLMVLLDTGIRADELCHLTLEDFRRDAGDTYIIVRKGKGRKQREIGVGTKTATALSRYIRAHRYALPNVDRLFTGRSGRAMTPGGVDQLLYRLRDMCNIVGVRVSAHTFRHTFAITYLKQGGDFFKLSRLLGHASTRVTEMYLKAFAQQDARKGTSVLDQMFAR